MSTSRLILTVVLFHFIRSVFLVFFSVFLCKKFFHSQWLSFLRAIMKHARRNKKQKFPFQLQWFSWKLFFMCIAFVCFGQASVQSCYIITKLFQHLKFIGFLSIREKQIPGISNTKNIFLYCWTLSLIDKVTTTSGSIISRHFIIAFIFY